VRLPLLLLSAASVAPVGEDAQCRVRGAAILEEAHHAAVLGVKVADSRFGKEASLRERPRKPQTAPHDEVDEGGFRGGGVVTGWGVGVVLRPSVPRARFGEEAVSDGVWTRFRRASALGEVELEPRREQLRHGRADGRLKLERQRRGWRRGPPRVWRRQGGLAPQKGAKRRGFELELPLSVRCLRDCRLSVEILLGRGRRAHGVARLRSRELLEHLSRPGSPNVTPHAPPPSPTSRPTLTK